MFARGFLDTTVTIKVLEAKMRTLLIAYKSAKDNNRQTGATSQAPFMEEMDEIFGREAIISNSRTLNLGARMQRPLSERCSLAAVESCLLPDTLLFSQNSFSNTESRCNMASTSKGLSNCTRDPLGDVPSSSGNSFSSPESLCYVASNRVPLTIGTSNPRKRKSAEENYYEKKLELK
ncbi:uncharacterized protein [Eurosta solidaginis]|uniref:uncharacterized protein n=1 Tax=Eurosta solidaginis TaxID=178769 RepID=UPI0035314A9B